MAAVACASRTNRCRAVFSCCKSCGEHLDGHDALKRCIAGLENNSRGALADDLQHFVMIESAQGTWFSGRSEKSQRLLSRRHLLKRRRIEKRASRLVNAEQLFDALPHPRLAGTRGVQEGSPHRGILQVQRAKKNGAFIHGVGIHENQWIKG